MRCTVARGIESYSGSHAMCALVREKEDALRNFDCSMCLSINSVRSVGWLIGLGRTSP